ncbi:MAG: HisS family protein [Candidatus Bipolaricaulota bacterium]|nr:HisS family protein [Candidatus Bipolaricaulota bacterium]
MTYDLVRGMYDILPDEIPWWQLAEDAVREMARRYNYREIRVPLVEHTELFTRGVGEATDIVTKEMYTFQDRGERSLTLRPEGTASVARAYLTHGWQTREPFQKLFYLGPMFRYEKPQKGRNRQFHQYGIEVLGALDPSVDAEVIAFAWSLMEILGLGGRILDCKETACQSFIAQAPGSADHLCPECAAHFEAVQGWLNRLGLAYDMDPRLVRGLDYYTRTVFELMSSDLGSQDTLIGGGRYDGLIEMLGGPPTPGIGFAGGLERLVLVLRERRANDVKTERLDLFIATVGEEGRRVGMKLATELRRLKKISISVDIDHRARTLRKQMAQANQLYARTVIVLGEDEARVGRGKLKDMDSGEEREVPLDPESLAELVYPACDDGCAGGCAGGCGGDSCSDHGN